MDSNPEDRTAAPAIEDEAPGRDREGKGAGGGGGGVDLDVGPSGGDEFAAVKVST